MISRLLDAFFGCWHTNFSFPITTRSAARRSVIFSPILATDSAIASATVSLPTLVCGKEFAYDWRQMKIVDEAPEPTSAVADLAPKQAA